MVRHRYASIPLALALACLGSVPAAHAGLEFCVPECSDGNPCTCDFENPDGTCSHEPQTRWASAARAGPTSGERISTGITGLDEILGGASCRPAATSSAAARARGRRPSVSTS